MKIRRAKTYLLMRVLFYLALIVLAYLALRRVAVVIAPVATGLFIAYLLNPATERLERRGVPRPTAIVLLLLLAACVLGALVVVLPPLVSNEIAAFSDRWRAAQDPIQATVLPWARKVLHLSRSASAEDMVQKLLARAEKGFETASLSATDAFEGAFHTATGLLRLLVAVLLTPVFAIYFLSDFPHLRDGATKLVPPRHREQVLGLVREINHALASWVRGQLTVMTVLGILYATGLALTGVPLGILIGLTTGLMAFVPYVGVLVGLGLALGAALLDAHPASAIAGVAATFGAVQTLDTFLVTPRILGGRVGLSPVSVIFALTLGGELLGYAGVLLAVPVAAVVKVLLDHAREVYTRSAFYTGEDVIVPAPAISPEITEPAEPRRARGG